MIEQTTRYGIATSLATDQADAIGIVRDELAKEGFGVLSEIDISATLKKKLDANFPPYVILGACNPPLAQRALLAERDLGLLLPCNVVVYRADEGRTVVAAMDPEAALELTGNPAVREVAREVRARLERVLLGVERTAADRAGVRDAAVASRGSSHYDGDHPEEPLPLDHFTAEQLADARGRGDGSPGLDE